MPMLDGTGPRGEGSRTGRGLGYCGDHTRERRPRKVYRKCRRPKFTSEEELDILEKEKKLLKKELEEIEDRIRDLERATED